MKKILLFLLVGFCIISLYSCKKEVVQETKSVSLDKQYYVIGETIGFNLENYESIDQFYVSFDTTNGIKENADGTFTARRVGTYNATVTLKENSEVSYNLEFNIYKKTFQLDSTTLTIAVGDKAEVWVFDFKDLYETKDEDFIYSVNNDNATIDQYGVLTANKVGDVTVTATSKFNSNVKSEITIKVGDENSDVMIRPSKELCRIKVGEELPMTLTGGYDPNEFVWLCENSEIARVTKYDGELQVTGVKEGKAFITCYNINDPSIKHKYLVTVEDELMIDYRKRLIELAYEQVGIKEGLNPDGSYDNMTKFGIWYGNYGEPWCATFVSWVWYHAGLSNDLLLKYQGCTAGMQWCLEQGIFEYKENYTPKTGDIVFFLSAGAGHTGIVAHCDGTYIYTIEGNRSNRVDVWRIKLTNKTITGYGVPNYPGLQEYDDFAWIKEQQADGSYLWTDVTSGDSTQ